jgi:hypothetical protein
MMMGIGAAGIVCVSAITFGVWRFCRGPAGGEDGLQIWFYDQSERKLYPAGRDTIPPHEGIGGPQGDGVRAIVVAAQAECGDKTRQRTAYLETYTPELKQLHEGIRAARKAGRAYGKPLPSGESGFYEKNTLVRRVDDPRWYDMATPEAGRIVAQWRSERGPKGEALDVCTP